jgi:hypothetical protein
MIMAIEVNKIQTLHPEAGKQNKLIAIEKYEQIKLAILKLLADKPLTHSQLMQAIHDEVHSYFSGNVHWYGETVKLDLEARKLIKRDTAKPPLYSLS